MNLPLSDATPLFTRDLCPTTDGGCPKQRVVNEWVDAIIPQKGFGEETIAPCRTANNYTGTATVVCGYSGFAYRGGCGE